MARRWADRWLGLAVCPADWLRERRPGLDDGPPLECRPIRNRRELAALAGLLCGVYQIGAVHHDQGVIRAGNTDGRRLMVQQLAWVVYLVALSVRERASQRYQRGFALARELPGSGATWRWRPGTART